MGAQLDDPNREAVGLAPIWTGSGAPPLEEDEGQRSPRAPKAPKHAAPEATPAPAPSEDHAPGVT